MGMKYEIWCLVRSGYISGFSKNLQSHATSRVYGSAVLRGNVSCPNYAGKWVWGT